MTLLQQAVRSAGARSGGWVRRSSYLHKWLVLGAAIGVIAGLGAVVFYLALRGATHLFLGIIAGYTVPTPAAEGGNPGSGHFTRPWAIPLVVCLGGLISGALVFGLAPEAEGHGTDAAIDAVHKNPRMIRARAVVVKLISSAITIGSGGSGGREGPTAQISAGFGSLLARLLDLSPEDGRVAVSVGIGSGIGAIFGAPLGGAVLAADIVYRDDFEVEALIPGLIASVISYTVFGLINGFSPLFGYAAPGYQFHQPLQLVWFAIIGLLAGLVGLVYSTTFYGVVDLTGRAPIPRWVKPAVGGLLVGLLALALPQVLGTGYGWVQQSLDRTDLLAIPLWVVLLMPLAKILATSLSIGSGGSGGIFGPGMVIGAFTGGALWRVLEPIAPDVPHSPAPFVIVGMMACFGAIARAPLAVMLMVAEMTGSLTILAPAMVAVGLAYLIVRRTGQTIYRSQLANREQAQASRLLTGLPLLARIPVVDAVAAPRLVLPDDTPRADAITRLERAGVPGAPVVDTHELFLGTVAHADLADADERPDRTIAAHVDAAAPSVADDATLDQALDALPAGARWLTVLDTSRHVTGVLAVSDIVHAYQRAARDDARRLAQLAGSTRITDLHVDNTSPLAGHPIGRAPLPDGAIVVSVQRGNAVLPATSTTTVEPGDTLMLLTRSGREGSSTSQT